MRLSKLEGKTVIGLTGAQKLGKVDDAFSDSYAGKIVGLKITGLQDGTELVTSIEHVKSIGPDAVIVDSKDSLEAAGAASNVANLISLKSLLNNRVVTEGGQVLGTLYDVEIDPRTHQIVDYHYDGGPLGEIFHRGHILQPKDVIGSGPGLVTVSSSAATPPTKAA
ncbi:MAG TPA: PRC-barrel domain-containing protein [Chloroflexota bacterium]|nr:PRC-barrel domain-containing protein [Chloroflexota bacterium]